MRGLLTPPLTTRGVGPSIPTYPLHYAYTNYISRNQFPATIHDDKMDNHTTQSDGRVIPFFFRRLSSVVSLNRLCVLSQQQKLYNK